MSTNIDDAFNAVSEAMTNFEAVGSNISDAIIPELNPRLGRGEWQKLCCSICDKKAPSVWWLADHFGGRSDTEGATGEEKPITHGMGM